MMAATAQLPLLDDFPASPLIRLASADSRDVTFEAVPTRSVLNSPAATHMPFWSINPYIGCEFGCTYCYARDTHRWTMERTEGAGGQGVRTIPSKTASWSRSTRRRSSAAPSIPTRIDGAPIVIGTATDPYQPAERRFRITRGLLESLLPHRGLHLGIITKSPLITRDTDLLVQLAERHTRQHSHLARRPRGAAASGASRPAPPPRTRGSAPSAAWPPPGSTSASSWPPSSPASPTAGSN